jgi:hypothetical protein
MATEPNFELFMARIRQEICRPCSLRPEGGPPCSPKGVRCAVEMKPEELVALVRADAEHSFCDAVYRAMYQLEDAGPVS